MTFEIYGIEIPVVIIRKKNKNIYMRFKSDTLQVTCNKWVSQKEIERILEKNCKSLEKMWKKYELTKVQEESFYYLGKPYKIVYDEKNNRLEIEGDKIYVKNEDSLEKFLKEECKRVFLMELKRILPYFDNIPLFTLKIRKMKTRWGVNNLGSHSITLNSELLKKDLDLIDYVIIHELCHFYQANHSQSFWREVEKYYPNYKEARKRLRG